MKNIKYIYICVAMIFLATSCNDDILEVDVTDAFGEDLIYSDPDQVEKMLYSVYNSTESWGVNKFNWWGRRFNIEAASFEGKFNFKDLDQFRLRAGWNPSNVGVFGDKWRNYYLYIREANEFLDRIDASEAMAQDPAKVNIIKAEMLFLRANCYAKLINYFGGVPLFDSAHALDDDFAIVRNTYEECVDFIVKDLDAAIPLLPVSRPADEFGRATRLAAMAVKSRVLLYAASPLHDGSAEPMGPMYDYTKTTKWQDASDAAKAIIDLVGERDLIAVADATEYQNLFLSPNDDILFARPFGAAYYDFGTDVNSLWDQTMSPSGYGGWALSSPSLNFALEFNMADGSDTETGSYNAAAPNDNREMRYYADLNYNGATFRDREVEYFLSEDVNVHPHGVDSPEGLGNALHSSKTGYNIRKFQDESLTTLTTISAGRPRILYRLAEIYLNYAEAQFNLPASNEVEARKFLNKVSTRALQPAITATGADLLEAIKRERRVELCFEGHNFFDERRWRNQAHVGGYDVKGLSWTKDAAGVVSPTEVTVVTRPWFEALYYLPIPQSEVNKAPTLDQNYGYN